MWWSKDWEHFSGSIPETKVSPVKQDTGVALDIGRANHDYSCSSNADSRWGATSFGPENRTGTGWQWLNKVVPIEYSVCKRREPLKKLWTLREVSIVYIHTFNTYPTVIQRISVVFRLDFLFSTVIKLLSIAEKIGWQSDFRNRSTIRPSDVYKINGWISIGFPTATRLWSPRRGSV